MHLFTPRRAIAEMVAGLVVLTGAAAVLPSAPASADTGAMITPTDGVVTSRVGAGCNSSRPSHKGIDIANGIGTRVVAAYAGRVTRRVDPGGYGNWIEVTHSNGYTTRYGHLSRYVAATGSTVAKGQLIAYSGNTGGSTGPHLHFEVRRNGVSQTGINAYFSCGRRAVTGQAIGWSFPGLPAGGGGGGGGGSTARESINDVNGDRRGDLVAIAGGTMRYYRNTGGASPYGPVSQLGGGWSTKLQPQLLVEDVTGDGAADLVTTRADGSLWVYPSDRSSSPFSSGSAYAVGQGWNSSVRRLLGADLNGDGRGDLVAVRSDGTLVYYRNNGSGSRASFAAGVGIGQGWAGFASVQLGDLSGDGHADLVAIDSSGRLWYYPNNSGTNAGGKPFETGDRRQIGTSWKQFNRLILADVSGDGSADALATKSDGTLWYYPNNRGANPGGVPFTSGRNVGHGWDSTVRIAGAQPISS